MADGSVTIDTKLNNDGFKSGLGKLGSIAGTALKGVTVAVGTVATALTGLGVAATSSYADLEQNIGGIETLFGSSADKVIKNAENAYKTAGMSANEYMQNVTSFSASLLQSVAGDTNKAADIADMAMTDMSDNANKMGTSMEAITNAYQGFAKQNYTMLDNLKLGYGGTKTEMERLLADAQKLTGVKYDINNLSDVYQAIHAIQSEMGITGTTAKEAMTTISGSVTSVKSAFDNFLNGSGKIEDLVEVSINAMQNIVNAVGDLLPNIVQSISNATPQIIEGINKIIPQILNILTTNLPTILTSVEQILGALAQAIINYIPQLIPIAMQLIQFLATALLNNLPQILQVGIQVITQLILGIAQMLPTLIPQAISCIITLVEGLLDNIDLLIDAAIQLIIGLAEGLINALPTLIEKIPVIIEKLVDAIVRNLPKIVEAGIKLIVMLAKGLIQAIPQLVAKIPQIISSILSGLSKLWEGMKDVGKNAIEGLWNGIKDMGSWIANKIKGFGEGVLSGIKNFFGIHSPSTVFRDEVGKYLAMGVGEGFDNNISKVYRQMKSAVDFETQKLSANLSTTASFNKILTANINVNGNVEMDSTRVGRLVAPAVSKTLRTAGV